MKNGWTFKKNVTQNNLLDYTPILGDLFYHFCATECSTFTTQRFSNSDSVPSSLRQDQYTALYTVGQNPHKNAIYQSGTVSVSINVLEFLTKIFDFLACCTLVYCKYFFSLHFSIPKRFYFSAIYVYLPIIALYFLLFRPLLFVQ